MWNGRGVGRIGREGEGRGGVGGRQKGEIGEGGRGEFVKNMRTDRINRLCANSHFAGG